MITINAYLYNNENILMWKMSSSCCPYPNSYIDLRLSRCTVQIHSITATFHSDIAIQCCKFLEGLNAQTQIMVITVLCDGDLANI